MTLNIPSGQGPFICESLISFDARGLISGSLDLARRGVILAGQGTERISLHVLEADVSPFNLSEARGMWADTTDLWDAVVICFDVTDPNPQGHLEDLLRKSSSVLGTAYGS